jgi:hypothetical protein
MQEANPSGRRTPLLLAIAVGLASLAWTASTVTAQPKAAASARAPSGPGLTAFQTNDSLRAYLRRLRQRQRRAENVEAEPVPMPAPVAAADSAQGVVSEASSPAAPSITNTQEANVDEGGIVKVSGDTLVILRRGRLFTVSLAGGRMRPVDSINAFPPGVTGQGDWYDEMLLSGDRVVVVGYSYARGGTEISRFRLDPSGKLRFEDAYHLRSNDYYSSRNYASRLIGNRLIFYTPLYLNWRDDPLEALPGIRRWRGNPADRSFTRIAGARQVYIPPAAMGGQDAVIDTLHSVTTCDLTAPVLDCSAIGVLGPSSRTFYVSGRAVYLWMADYNYADRRASRSYIYRLPLGNERPSAIGARGAPVDQFSFREDPAQGILNILVRSERGGDAMWRPEVTAGDVALLRIPIAEFGDGSREAARIRYRALPKPEGDSWNFHNRFVGAHVLYSAGAYGRRPGASTLYVVPLRGGAVAQLPVTHAVDRIEALGSDAMGVGSSPSGLGFTAVELSPGRAPRIGDNYTLPNAAEGESRSHAFFFSPDPSTPDGASGILGLPVARRADPAFRRFFGSAAAMIYLRRQNRQLSPAGELEARVEGTTDDGCTASCVDWYGNARPIFLPPRTFALLGYELVEGELERGRIREVGRVNFAPRARRRGD